ncbi:hypothetical protein KP509_07G047700 [Ceratopteris richardii]|uniref:Uncharacterized protein n=1 Tax=Ceratopteris richardii TaxID=49495 RepID=A0A8T2UHK1_CERRI|nr:hypothetical protein KP509_07G047700 [Ceratopteris richardii]
MAVPDAGGQEGDAPVVSQIAREGNPAADALVEAARYGDIDDVKELVEQGVHVNIQDMQGRTALHMAAANGHMDVVSYLLDRGADTNIENNEKNTPLHWAALNGQIQMDVSLQVSEELIARGANASALNRYDRTPLDEAMSRGKQQVVDAIVAATAATSLASSSVQE